MTPRAHFEWHAAGTVIGLMMLVGAATSSARANAKPDPRQLAPSSITVDVRPISAFKRGHPEQTKFGHLEFLGGLVLTSPDSQNFGGWSGVAMGQSRNDDGSLDLAAVSDSGVWLTATLVSKGRAPLAVHNARLGPILALDGNPLKRSRDRDAEALALLSGSLRDGSVLIAYEQNSRLARHDITRDGFSQARELLEKPPAAGSMRRNNGFEAMTVMQGGAFKGRPIAISERLYDPWRNHTGWIWTLNGIKPFHITNIGDFDVTDIASLDDGTLFVLERRFRWLEGVKMRLRRIAPDALQPDKTIEGETLIEADMDYEIDNMEGLAATRVADGGVVLTVLSDDNFNASLQRTLLLQFALPGLHTAKTRP